ncbi:hypothetical protein TNCV_1567471 [Trichonephila clavipes]|nr:hypothetical protein TNCV_1567471 [Trichonephila clavipes]
MSYTLGLDLQTTVSGKCPRSPEDEQEKQGESRDSSVEEMNLRMAQDIGTRVREITTPYQPAHQLPRSQAHPHATISTGDVLVSSDQA